MKAWLLNITTGEKARGGVEEERWDGSPLAERKRIGHKLKLALWLLTRGLFRPVCALMFYIGWKLTTLSLIRTKLKSTVANFIWLFVCISKSPITYLFYFIFLSWLSRQHQRWIGNMIRGCDLSNCPGYSNHFFSTFQPRDRYLAPSAWRPRTCTRRASDLKDVSLQSSVRWLETNHSIYSSVNTRRFTWLIRSISSSALTSRSDSHCV